MKTNKLKVKTEENLLGYTGSTPFAEFDENWMQMPLDRTKVTIPREHLTRMFPLAYLSGKLSVLKAGGKTSILLIIVLMLCFINLALIGWDYFTSSTNRELLFNSTDQLHAKIDNIDSEISSRIDLISEKLNITPPTEIIPTVG